MTRHLRPPCSISDSRISSLLLLLATTTKIHWIKVSLSTCSHVRGTDADLSSHHVGPELGACDQPNSPPASQQVLKCPSFGASSPRCGRTCNRSTFPFSWFPVLCGGPLRCPLRWRFPAQRVRNWIRIHHTTMTATAMPVSPRCQVSTRMSRH